MPKLEFTTNTKCCDTDSARAIKSLRNIRDKYQKKEGWIFRGQNDATWPLRTFFERTTLEMDGDNEAQAIQKAIDNTDDTTQREQLKYRKLQYLLKKGLPYKPYNKNKEDDYRSVFEIEEGLVRMFQRQVNAVTPEIQRPKGILEALAMMQHYGAPTTLMDWNYSVNIALYFAVETKSDKDCVVWALNADWFRRQSEAIITRNRPTVQSDDKNFQDDDNFRDLLRNKIIPCELVMPVNPFYGHL